MLDQIVKVVREGQTKRAPVERVADILTGYFVPVITLIDVFTFVIWFGLGRGGYCQRLGEMLKPAAGDSGHCSLQLQSLSALALVALLS